MPDSEFKIVKALAGVSGGTEWGLPGVVYRRRAQLLPDDLHGDSLCSESL
jgi:hypothetical protein